MKKSLKAVLTVLCSVALVFTMMPVNANAATMKNAPSKTAYIAYTDGAWASNTDAAMPDGWKAKDVKIKKAGTYTVSLDFTGTKDGVAKDLNFAALMVKDGETKFPNYTLKINYIKINGKKIALKKGFTSTDDGKETRMNIYNAWVDMASVDLTKNNVRSWDGKTSKINAVMVDKAAFASVKTISVNFTYAKKKK